MIWGTSYLSFCISNKLPGEPQVADPPSTTMNSKALDNGEELDFILLLGENYVKR